MRVACACAERFAFNRSLHVRDHLAAATAQITTAASTDKPQQLEPVIVSSDPLERSDLDALRSDAAQGKVDFLLEQGATCLALIAATHTSLGAAPRVFARSGAANMDKPLGVIYALAIAPILHLLAIGAAQAAEPAHTHGVVRLNVAIEIGAVTLQLEAPLDSLVGFEHAPRTAAQKDAVQAMLERFKTPQSLFGFPRAAQCALKSSSAESDAFEASKPASGEEHADLDGSFVFDCKQATAVDSMDIAGLLAAFPRIARIDAVIVAPGGQFKRVLKRPEKLLRWGR